MKCPKCKNKNFVKRGKRYNKFGTKQLYLCRDCNTTFIEPDGFEKMRHKKEDVVRAIHLHEKGLSLFNTADHLWQHDGVKITKQSVGNWCMKYSNFLKSDNKT